MVWSSATLNSLRGSDFVSYGVSTLGPYLYLYSPLRVGVATTHRCIRDQVHSLRCHLVYRHVIIQQEVMHAKMQKHQLICLLFLGMNLTHLRMPSEVLQSHSLHLWPPPHGLVNHAIFRRWNEVTIPKIATLSHEMNRWSYSSSISN